MKITETVERDCCATRDLRPYNGTLCRLSTNEPSSSNRNVFLFCQHCGQVWEKTKEMGPAGSLEPVLARVKLHAHACHEEEQE